MKFIGWQFHSSLVVIVLISTAAGVMMAVLLGLSQAHFVCEYDCESSRDRLPAWSRTPDDSEHIRFVCLYTLPG